MSETSEVENAGSVNNAALPDVSASSAEIEQRIGQIAPHGFFQNFQRKCRAHAEHVARHAEDREDRCRYLRELGRRHLPLDAAAIDYVIARAMEVAPPQPSPAPPLQPDGGEPASAAVIHEPPAAGEPATVPPTTPHQRGMVPPLPEADGSLRITTLDSIEPEPVDWLWPDRIAFGRLTILAGHPGLGKSHAALSIAATVTRGGAWPCGEGRAPGGDVIVLTAEDSLSQTVRPRLDAAGGDPRRVHVIHAVVRADQERGFDLAGDVALLERELARRPQVRLVIIDPVTAYLSGSGDRGENVRPALTRLAAMAERRRVAVLLVTHLSKTSRGALERIHGSIAWAAVIRAAFLVMADPRDETRRLFVEIKNNLAASSGLAFRLTSRAIASGLDGSHVEWEDALVAASAEELLRQQPKPDTGAARREAIAFLLAVLGDGPKPVREIEREGIRAGILTSGVSITQARAFRAARERLGVHTSRSGGLGEQGEWVWALPVGEGDT